MSAADVRRTAIPRTLSMAKQLGEAVLASRNGGGSPIDAICSHTHGMVLFQGKIMDVARRTTTGFAKGHAEIEGLGSYRGHNMVVEFQNGNLIAFVDGEVVCTTPDLICVVDTDRGEPITTELMRYGFRVTVLGFPAPQLWTSDKALAVAGPRAFGYDVDYSPLALS